MRIKSTCFTHHFLRRFLELRDLEFQFIEIILEKGEIITANKGEKIIECLFNDPVAMFLLQGQVSCQSGLLKKQLVIAESKEASSMLNNQLPKGGSVVAASDDAVLLLIKKKNIGEARIQSNKPLQQEDRHYKIADINEMDATNGDDWMSKLLSSPLFKQAEPWRIQKLFVNLNETRYKQDDLVIREGEHDQFFYIIKSGRAQVFPSKCVHSNPIIISEGGFFGEGAIVGETIHSASIKMLTDGIVCKIEAIYFYEIMKQTILKYADAGQIADAEKTKLKIDVRHPIEFRHEHLPDSVNLPINSLRNRLGELSKTATYIISHGEDKRSQLAALIFAEHGYNAFLVRSAASG